MKKEVRTEPIYESVQTGVNSKEVWVTSDECEFDNEKSAEHHEFYHCKVKQRGVDIPDNPVILDLYSIEDLERYEKDYTYNVEKFAYDKSKLTFPNTYVLIEKTEYGDAFGRDDDWYDYEIVLNIYTIEEFKKLINKELDSIVEI